LAIFSIATLDKLAALAARYSLPAIYADREIAEAVELISYGASRTDAYRQAGKYAGRVLQGERLANCARAADQI
jgi:putative ABC transport system substrate-binding protein